jgi:hypothetical protein
VKVGLGIEENIVPQRSCIANVVGFASQNFLESSLALRMLEFCERRDQSFCKATVESIQCSRKFENVRIWTQSAISCNSISYLLQRHAATNIASSRDNMPQLQKQQPH